MKMNSKPFTDEHLYKFYIKPNQLHSSTSIHIDIFLLMVSNKSKLWNNQTNQKLLYKYLILEVYNVLSHSSTVTDFFKMWSLIYFSFSCS